MTIFKNPHKHTAPRILVVSYAHDEDGHTLARQLARACGADLDVIQGLGTQDSLTHRLIAGWRAALHLGAPIRPMRHDPRVYDMVVIGTTISLWNVPAPVRAYLETHRSDLRRISLFCTHDGIGHDRVLRDLTNLCGRPAAATMVVHHETIARKKHSLEMGRFARTIKTSCRILSKPKPSDASGPERTSHSSC
ncbi:MAG: hypothetical protein V4454_14050 [Pseudomonadota bacterium]